MKKYMLFFSVIALAAMSGCVTSKKFNEQLMHAQNMERKNGALQNELEKLTKENAFLEVSLENINKDKTQLLIDTAECGKQLRQAKDKNAELDKMYNEMVAQNQNLLASSSREMQKLNSELTEKRRQLESREEELNKQQQNISKLQSEVAAREQKVKELEELLQKKDRAVADLRRKIEDALLNFDKDELTVEVRDGKIYVSLAEELLFKSGSTGVDKKGKDALNKLAGVLEKQKDIDIMVEGHTDSIPITTSCIRDNWDLSVLRATSIVRILTQDNKVDVKRVVPSGRGENIPVADNKTSEGRAKNRRTEIILSPRLDEIFKILEGGDGSTR